MVSSSAFRTFCPTPTEDARQSVSETLRVPPTLKGYCRLGFRFPGSLKTDELPVRSPSAFELRDENNSAGVLASWIALILIEGPINRLSEAHGCGPLTEGFVSGQLFKNRRRGSTHPYYGCFDSFNLRESLRQNSRLSQTHRPHS